MSSRHGGAEKYCDHLPVYRQMIRFDRAGIKLAHSTLLDWIARTCTLLQPLYESLKAGSDEQQLPDDG
nr:IS66 family transposase [Pedobacter cryoconitis]